MQASKARLKAPQSAPQVRCLAETPRRHGEKGKLRTHETERGKMGDSQLKSARGSSEFFGKKRSPDFEVHISVPQQVVK
jgi:hypothetical protein